MGGDHLWDALGAIGEFIGAQLACRAISTHVVARNFWEDVD
ncbi:MAG: hypothetical protein ACI9UU_001227 [Candidatus Azotimanducaceae bacterium]|jgi:hypothetical protein